MKNQGFTLIELSIVLVIIGLIVGGVLVGRDLILAAQLRKGATLIEQLDTAVNTFNGKYNCLPGDCKNATSFGFAANGDGDGNIYAIGNCGSENYYFFQMLIDAKLLNDTRVCTLSGGTIACSTNCPGYNFNMEMLGLTIPFSTVSKIGHKPAIGVVNSSVVNALSVSYKIPFLHAYGFSEVTSKAYANVTLDITAQLDRKFDDGLPLSGKIITLYPQDDAEVAPDNRYYSDANTCMNRATTPYIYNTPTAGYCTVIWGASF